MPKRLKRHLGTISVEEKAQDAFEYLLMVGGVSVVVVLATIVMTGLVPGIIATVTGLVTGVL